MDNGEKSATGLMKHSVAMRNATEVAARDMREVE